MNQQEELIQYLFLTLLIKVSIGIKVKFMLKVGHLFGNVKLLTYLCKVKQVKEKRYE